MENTLAHISIHGPTCQCLRRVKGHLPIGETAIFSKVTSETLSKPQRGGHTVVHIIPAGGGEQRAGEYTILSLLTDSSLHIHRVTR